MRYFLKELVSTPLYTTSGAPIRFETIQGDQGLIATEDGFVTSQLETAIRRRVGGIVEIKESRYVDLKKNSASGPGSELSSLKEPELRQRLVQLQNRLAELGDRAAAVKKITPATPVAPVKESEPLVVPDLEPLTMKPKRGRPANK